MTEVRPFTDKQIKLLETFADQAVIAIENVRLFKELQERNAELREALEHQTATAEVLGIISRSPTDVQPVLDAIVESAARVCGIDDVVLRLREGNAMVPRAHFGPIPIGRVEISIDEPQYRWMREHGTLHVPDVRAQNDFPMVGSAGGWRTFLAVPLRQQGELIGILSARRTEVRPFTPAQIKLLETFADQAVIAIENVRLFKELDARNRDLTEALEQQTATSEVLNVISRSTFDLQPVLETLIENAARLCAAKQGFIMNADGDVYHMAVAYGVSREYKEFMESQTIRPGRGTVLGRVAVERQTVHIPDVLADPEYQFAEAQKRGGFRTNLGVPMLREGVLIGVFVLHRNEVRPFTDKQIELLETFADQAVIAIENVRLFQELEARTRELARSVGELRALGEVGQAVSSTLDLRNSAKHASLATRSSSREPMAALSTSTMRPCKSFTLGRATVWKRSWLRRFERRQSVSEKEPAGERRRPGRQFKFQTSSDEREYTGHGCGPCSHGSAIDLFWRFRLLREERIMGGLTVWRTGAGKFFDGSRESPSDLRDAIGPGDPKRAAVPRDRG